MDSLYALVINFKPAKRPKAVYLATIIQCIQCIHSASLPSKKDKLALTCTESDTAGLL